MFVKILGIVFVLMGALISFAASIIVGKYGLAEKVKVEFENEMDEEEIRKYKIQRATVNVKMVGMLLALPGIALVLIYF